MSLWQSADPSQLTQRFGMGIQPDDCEMEIAEYGAITLTQKETAR